MNVEAVRQRKSGDSYAQSLLRVGIATPTSWLHTSPFCFAPSLLFQQISDNIAVPFFIIITMFNFIFLKNNIVERNRFLM